MKKWIAFAVLGIALMGFNMSDEAETVSYKCLIQTINYSGEGAYVIVSLMNPEGNYEETLYILGEDPEWYHMIDEWWAFFGKKKRSTDGITGATIAGGERKVFVLDIPSDKFDKGYKLRFETSVEDQKYFPADLEIALDGELGGDKYEGTGYIQQLRLVKN